MPAFRTDAPPPLSFGDARPRLEFAQKAFILDGDRLLMVRKTASDPYHPGRWEVPGGRLEVAGDLDLDDHIRREVWEEVGLKIAPGPPFHLWQWFMPGRRRGRPGARPRPVRVVAAARLCRPMTREVSLENQTATDHLVDPTWVPLPEIDQYDLIPSLRPVMRAFLLMCPATSRPSASLPSAAMPSAAMLSSPATAAPPTAAAQPSVTSSATPAPAGPSSGPAVPPTAKPPTPSARYSTSPYPAPSWFPPDFPGLPDLPAPG
ncbi:NUDIX domain-containing protein [Spirillospora sp. CA-255316]